MVMEPQVKIFELCEISMKMAGMFPPSSRVSNVVAAFLQCLTLGNLSFLLVSMFTDIIFGQADFLSKLEILTISLVLTNMLYRLALLIIKRKEVFAHIGKINALLAKIESTYGEEIVQEWQNQCRQIMYFYCTVLTLLVIPAFLVAYYKHYVEGDVEAKPYEVYTPFDGATQFTFVIIFQFLIFFAPELSLVMSNTFIGTISVAVAGILGKISDRYSQLTPGNFDSTMRTTIQWHSEIIEILEEFNAFFGSAIMLDYLLAMVYLCIGTFMVFETQSDGDSKFYNYIFLTGNYFAVSLSCYLYGHRVSLASDILGRTVLQNEWYDLAPAQRRQLIFPVAMASQDLSFNYRKCIDFNLAAYLVIVRQSYSFLTLLNLKYSE